MKTIIAAFGIVFCLSQSTIAATRMYSCFKDGYEPGMAIEVLFEGGAFGITTYIQMPDGSHENITQYGSNANTIQCL